MNMKNHMKYDHDREKNEMACRRNISRQSPARQTAWRVQP